MTRVFLALLALVAMATAAEACPDWQRRAPFGHIQLTEGFLPDPYTRDVRAGGRYFLGNCGFDAAGWVAAAPDFDITYNSTGRSTLTIIVESRTDTVILVNDPNGQWWFDDDSGNDLGGRISIPNAPSGLYDIWVGTYDRGSGIPARLVVTELY
jgi:protease YdgD